MRIDVDQVSWLAWRFTDDAVSWSAGMYRLLGRQPDERRPTMALLAGQQHADDWKQARRAFERIRRDGQAFVFEHRLIRADGVMRTVIMSVRAQLDDAGTPLSVLATFVDVSEVRRIFHADSKQTVSGLQTELTLLAARNESRMVINQASGVLMQRHTLSSAEAALLLQKASQLAGRKIYDVASELLFSGQLPAGVTVAAIQPSGVRSQSPAS